MSTVLEKLCEINGCQGGTIHQMEREIKVKKRFVKSVFFSFGGKEFCISNFGMVIEMEKGKFKGFITETDLIDWFLEKLDAKLNKTKKGNRKIYRFK